MWALKAGSETYSKSAHAFITVTGDSREHASSSWTHTSLVFLVPINPSSIERCALYSCSGPLSGEHARRTTPTSSRNRRSVSYSRERTQSHSCRPEDPPRGTRRNIPLHAFRGAPKELPTRCNQCVPGLQTLARGVSPHSTTLVRRSGQGG